MGRFTSTAQHIVTLVRDWVRDHDTPDPPPDPRTLAQRNQADSERVVNVLLLIAAVLCFALLFA